MFFRLSSLVMLLLAGNLYCQQVSVNPLTGAVNYGLPLVTLTTGNIVYPISLSYQSSGIKVEEVTGIVGLGWQLNNTGVIYRDLRGLPDDYKGVSPDQRKGWLRGTAAADLKTATFSSDGSCTTCSDEYTDWARMNGYGLIQDTEPDRFTVSVPGFSFSFYFDNDGVIRFEDYGDFKITHVLNETSGITSFTVTDPTGNIYVFSNRSSISRGISETLTTSPYFNHSRKLYATSVTYTGAWYLTSITDVYNNSMSFSYATISMSHQQKNYEEKGTLEYKIAISTGAGLVKKNAYAFASTLNSFILNSITTTKNDKVVFSRGSFVHNTNTKVLKIELFANLTTSLKAFEFNYSNPETEDVEPTELLTEKYLLGSVVEKSGTKTNLTYGFEYYFSSRTLSVPVTSITAQDYWGYYNGNKVNESFPEIYVYPDLPASERYRLTPISSSVYSGTSYTLIGYKRELNINNITHNLLRKVIYPHGGSTTVLYEPNLYYDSVAQENLYGGGVRVKQLRTHDGVTANNIIETYEYKQGSNSSGVLIQKPVFAFPIIYQPEISKTFEQVTASYTAQQVWELMTARTNRSMATEGEGVVYKRVTVKPATGGSTEYNYTINGLYGSASAGGGEWQSTAMKVSRRNNGTCDATGQLGSLSGNGFTFPFIRNANYDFNRGLLRDINVRDATGKLVSRTVNTYGRKYKGGALHRTKAVGIETHPTYKPGTTPLDDSTLYVFGTYDLITGVKVVLNEQHVFTPHSLDSTRFLETVSYTTYGSTHPRPIESRIVNSNGDESINAYKYPDDYTVTGTTRDNQSNLIKTHVTKNMLVTPVEQVSLRKLNGSSTREVTGARLTLYEQFFTASAVPGSIRQLVLPSPISESLFSYATVTNTGSQSTFTSDPRYITSTQNLEAHSNGIVLSAVGRDKVATTVLIDNIKKLPAFAVKGAKSSELAFADFDMHSYHEFFAQDGFTASFIGSGRTSNAIKLQRALSYGLECEITREQDLYILSYWANTCTVQTSDGSPPGTGNLKAFFYNGATLVKTVTLIYTAPTTGWTYFENTIDLTGLVANLRVVVASEYNNTCFDDVALYPANSVTTSFAYDAKNQLILSTDNKGRGTKYEYDDFGRVIVVRDHNNNIIETNTYNYGN